MDDTRPTWIDGDLHLLEPTDLWQDHLAPEYREFMPRWAGQKGKDHPLASPKFVIRGTSAKDDAVDAADPDDGARVPPAPDPAAADPAAADPGQLGTNTDGVRDRIGARRLAEFEPYFAPEGTYIDAAGQIRGMETEGIEIGVLFPTHGAVGWAEEGIRPDVALAIARAYNSWLHDFCRADPRRLQMNALIPLGDVDGAVREMRRAAEELGAISIVPGTSRSDIRLDDPAYEPIWSTVEDLDLTIGFHGRRQVHLKERYRDSTLMSHICGRGIEHPVAFMELLTSGVLERHPTMRCAFLEAGCSWVLYWLFRLEQEWDRFHRDVPGLADNMRHRPLEYWQRQCWTNVEVDEWPVEAVISLIGDENLVLSSDFPHFDSPFPETRSRFLKMPGLSDASKRKILWDNCARLYNLPTRRVDASS
jgi:predicted TIM-barrel fold metal-dependent hydrolase